MTKFKFAQGENNPVRTIEAGQWDIKGDYQGNITHIVFTVVRNEETEVVGAYHLCYGWFIEDSKEEETE